MKKLLLIVSAVLAIAGMAMAQNIYTVGNCTNSSGYQCAVVYLNNTKLFEVAPPLGDYDNDATCLTVVDGDVYWAMNSEFSASGLANSATWPTDSIWCVVATFRFVS